ncbi:IclR family transcriptional regulator [Microaceticoccus formicicus]|uniref:IclR family transcriptional regulator n=1 Tax=Microaceticoccus formicicus TaxID=3118105 RepID=UPI003CD0038D|nr:IclR family transcriptional regulator [Peptoniphilaceae bacterium AMB_02]
MTKGNIQSVERAFYILEAIASSNGMGVTEISNSLNLNKSTAFGLIKTLESLGYIFKNWETDKYKLTYKFATLVSEGSLNDELVQFSKPYLDELSKKYNETIHFVAGTKDEVYYLEKIESKRSIRVYTGIGQSRPLYCTAVGKAILSMRSKDEIEEYIKHNKLERHTQNTIIDSSELMSDLEKARKNGYAIDNCESQDELYCIGVPIMNKMGEGYFALSISFPVFRKSEHNLDEMIQDLLETKENIERFF